MLLNEELAPINNAQVQSIDFFHDFIAFLNWLSEKPIKRTITGNISLRDIGLLLPQLRTIQSVIDDHKKFNWRLHSEQELQTLTQIKVIAGNMYLIYRRKGTILLSKNGRGFLTNLSPVQQYEQMVLNYWYQVNWEYFTPSKTVKGQTLSELLQKKQNYFWSLFLQKGEQWIDYEKFCKTTRDYFNLHEYFDDAYLGADYELYSDIDFTLFYKNLVLFGCVETEVTSTQREWERKIKQFHSTPVGLNLFNKAVHENYLFS
ncbi:MAG: hypothetical protein ACR2LN_06590 [Candidatus Levyibacteriota bacterium]